MCYINFLCRYDRVFSCLICAATDVNDEKRPSMRRLSFFSTSTETKAHLLDEHGIEYDLTDEEVAPRKRKTPKSGAVDNNSPNYIIFM